jgi:hypothetical protein
MAHNKDENNSQEIMQLMKRLQQLKKIGFTILLVHHVPKNDSRTYKGSTAISDLADHVVALNRTTNEKDSISYVLRTGKTRFEKHDPLFLEFDSGGKFRLVIDPDQEWMKGIASYIENKSEVSQTEIINFSLQELKLTSKKTIRLLKKGGEKYWNSKTVGNKRIYFKGN